jgi:putative membrane protein
MKFLISILLNGLLVYFASWLLSGVHVSSFFIAIIAGLALGIVNLFIKPIITFLTLPITIITLGLFLFVINGAMVLFVDGLVIGFSVDGLTWAIIFSVVLAFLNLLIGNYPINTTTHSNIS